MRKECELSCPSSRATLNTNATWSSGSKVSSPTFVKPCIYFYENPFLRSPWNHHHHLSLNREGRWGTTDDFATSFLHFSLFSTAFWDLANSRPVHSLMLSFAIADDILTTECQHCVFLLLYRSGLWSAGHWVWLAENSQNARVEGKSPQVFHAGWYQLWFYSLQVSSRIGTDYKKKY